jgi:hypothetical protein
MMGLTQNYILDIAACPCKCSVSNEAVFVFKESIQNEFSAIPGYIVYLIAIQLVTRRRKAFTIFIPSRCRIEFLQKNITQLNVEFKEVNVLDHRKNNKNCLSDNADGDAKRKAEYIMTGHTQQKKQPTAKEHVELMLFRFKIRVFIFSSIDVVAVVGTSLSSSRFDFAILKILYFA